MSGGNSEDLSTVRVGGDSMVPNFQGGDDILIGQLPRASRCATATALACMAPYSNSSMRSLRGCA